MKLYRLSGPPGCGKTRALATSWIPRAVDKFGPKAVLVASLTKTAATEIAGRSDLPRECVGTLHSFAYRGLGSPQIAETKPAIVQEWNNDHPGWALSGRSADVDDPLGGVDTKETDGDRLFAQAQVHRHRLDSKDAWHPDATRFHAAWLAFLAEQGATDFTGLIEQAIDDVPSAPGHPAVLVIDEGQDSSRLELKLVREWAASAESVVLAGDANQAIYGFRGATSEAFLEDQIPEDQNYYLRQSYRLSPDVHASAQQWLERDPGHHRVEFKPCLDRGQGEARQGNFHARSPEAAVLEAVQDAQEGRDVMILATCGFHLSKAVHLLKELSVPFHNPYRPTHGGWNPLSLGARALKAFLRPDPRTWGVDGAALWSTNDLWSWVSATMATVFPHGTKAALEKLRSETKESDKKRPLSPQEVGRLLGQETATELRDAFMAGTTAALDWWLAKLLPQPKRRLEYAISLARTGGVEVLYQEPKITVGTVHSVKGGQAASVYLMDDLSMSARHQWAYGDRASIVRTMYVGMTRAQTKLVCGHARGGASSL